MKPSELRLGNYVKAPLSGLAAKVTEITPTDIKTEATNFEARASLYNDDFYDNIPISEEWLRRFGFTEKKSPVSVSGYDFHKAQYVISESTETLGERTGQVWSVYLKSGSTLVKPAFAHIYNVDELQNLWFVLTHNDLDIIEG